MILSHGYNADAVTYFLPVGSRSGLRSPSFNAPKTSSMGAVEYEYGPEYIMGSYILASLSFISGLLCHDALSRRIVEFSYQPGVSESSLRTKYCMNVVITSESVLA